MLARIVAHGEFLITEVLDLKHKNVVPTGGDRIGTVILDSRQIGFSEEALKLLEKIPKGRDAIGDVDWFEIYTKAGKQFSFAWIGPINRIMLSSRAEGSRDYQVHRDACTIISNEVTPEMLKAIKDKQVVWKEPASL